LGRALCLECARGSSAAVRTDLRSCRLGKYPWEIAAWDKAVGKVPDIIIRPLMIQIMNSTIKGLHNQDPKI